MKRGKTQEKNKIFLIPALLINKFYVLFYILCTKKNVFILKAKIYIYLLYEFIKFLLCYMSLILG